MLDDIEDVSEEIELDDELEDIELPDEISSELDDAVASFEEDDILPEETPEPDAIIEDEISLDDIELDDSIDDISVEELQIEEVDDLHDEPTSPIDRLVAEAEELIDEEATDTVEEIVDEVEEVTEEDEPAAEIEENIEDILPETEEEVADEPADPIEDIVEEADEEDPMADLKAMSAESTESADESFDKLKTLSKRIIDGEAIDLGIDIKGEITELLKLIKDTKERVDEIEPVLATSNEQIPSVLNTLASVTESTEDATLSLMENADGLNNYYQEFIGEISDLEDLIYRKDVAAIVKKIEQLENDINNTDKMGYNILHALEFQDITEQKLNKVIGSVSDIGARLGAILGFIKLKQEQDPTSVDDASQDDIDKLLADFGLD